DELYSWETVLTLRGFLILAVGGLMVGFGARYAGGCTSGHAISGLSDLQWPSLLAVMGFFLGGLVMTHVLFPVLY
ncbi:MAG: YeeE/YedE family protein, partial [Bacteroidota bacterium]